jgi:hypothetical protein
MPDRKNNNTSPVPGRSDRQVTEKKRDERHEGSVSVHRDRVNKNEARKSEAKKGESSSSVKAKD